MKAYVVWTAPIVILIVLLILCFIYWRFYLFFRDPNRKIPKGNNIVSPADGRIVYVEKVRKNIIPISIKKGRQIRLHDIAKTKLFSGDKYIVGVFMNPFNVHVNRSPIDGKIERITHYYSKDLPMTKMWIRSIFNLIPLYKGSNHVVKNERNTILINGKFHVAIVQIADVYVKKILCFVNKGQVVSKGQRIGMIRMGSQVDIIFPAKKSIRINVRPGDKVKAGSSIIATY